MVSVASPWFPTWPTDAAARGNVVRSVPAAVALPMRSTADFLESGKYPAKFLQLIPFESETIPPGMSVPVAIRFDDDFRFRMDAIQGRASGVAGAADWIRVSVELPSGRMLTRNFVSLSAFCTQQGGRSFVYFRHRFAPGDSLILNFQNVHPSAALSVQGVLVGFKMTGESQL